MDGSLVVAGFGLLLCGMGVLLAIGAALGWSGRLLRGSPRMRGTAYASGLWSGVSFLFLAVTGLPPLRESMWGVLFALPWLGFLGLSLCCYFSHRPPAWALPPWQRKYIRPHRAKPGPAGDERR